MKLVFARGVFGLRHKNAATPHHDMSSSRNLDGISMVTIEPNIVPLVGHAFFNIHRMSPFDVH